MKKGAFIFIIELIISFVISVVVNQGPVNYDFFTLLGLINLIIGVLSFFISLIIYFVDKETARPFFIASGLLLLAGCLTCSIFPIRLNSH